MGSGQLSMYCIVLYVKLQDTLSFLSTNFFCESSKYGSCFKLISGEFRALGKKKIAEKNDGPIHLKPVFKLLEPEGLYSCRV